MADEIDVIDETGEPVPANQRYDAQVSLSPEEVQAAFADDEDVAWFPDGNPPPFGMPGRPPFEAWRTGEHAFVVRSQVPARIQVASPYVLIEVSPIEGGGSRVKARFVRRPPGVQLSKPVRVFAAVVCVLTLLGVIAYLFIIPLMLLNPNLMLMIVTAVVGLITLSQYSKNRPTPQSMAQFGGPLWGLIGRKLVPHALGDGEDPFRLKALGVRSR